jgi:hypothetical protein
MAEFNCIGDNSAFGDSIDKFDTTVGLLGWTNVEVILGTKVPRPSRCWLGMDEGGTTSWP